MLGGVGVLRGLGGGRIIKRERGSEIKINTNRKGEQSEVSEGLAGSLCSNLNESV